MKLPASAARLFARFDALATRERVLVGGAVLIGTALVWVTLFLDPLTEQQRRLGAELATLQDSILHSAESIETAIASDPTAQAQREKRRIDAQLATINAQLAAKSGGLIPPELMVQVIHDVLSRQRGVTLVRLHNKPVSTLVPTAAQVGSAGPYVHPVEIVVEGTYLDVLAYLHALEALEWRFYWRLLELESTTFPRNRVRIELSTLSLDKDWIGV
jgi:MSHA biogenesis protein MshJ